MYSMIRTIQPVGEGGFYTEIFSGGFNGNVEEFCYVYDCGSSSRGEPGRTIGSALPAGMVIEALFISHFDRDHINGIKKLKQAHKIHHIVMPQIDGYKWFYVIFASILKQSATVDSEFIEDVETLKDEIPTVQVDFFDDTTPPHSDVEIDDIPGAGVKIPCGTILITKFKEPLWVYIPVNIGLKVQIENLKRRLTPIFQGALGSTFQDFESLSGEDCAAVINNHRREINDVYKAVFGTSNAASMALYSGLKDNYYNVDTSFSYRQSCCDCCGYHMRRDYPEACLYTGDSNLKNEVLYNLINRRFPQLIEHIGLAQIPHHGSIYNSDSPSLSALSRQCPLFVSYGTQNTFSHPSSYLLGHLRSCGFPVFEVTERNDTTLSEMIRIGRFPWLG